MSHLEAATLTCQQLRSTQKHPPLFYSPNIYARSVRLSNMPGQDHLVTSLADKKAPFNLCHDMMLSIVFLNCYIYAKALTEYYIQLSHFPSRYCRVLLFQDCAERNIPRSWNHLLQMMFVAACFPAAAKSELRFFFLT